MNYVVAYDTIVGDVDVYSQLHAIVDCVVVNRYAVRECRSNSVLDTVDEAIAQRTVSAVPHLESHSGIRKRTSKNCYICAFSQRNSTIEVTINHRISNIPEPAEWFSIDSVIREGVSPVVGVMPVKHRTAAYESITIHSAVPTRVDVKGDICVIDGIVDKNAVIYRPRSNSEVLAANQT